MHVKRDAETEPQAISLFVRRATPRPCGTELSAQKPISRSDSYSLNGLIY